MLCLCICSGAECRYTDNDHKPTSPTCSSIDSTGELGRMDALDEELDYDETMEDIEQHLREDDDPGALCVSCVICAQISADGVY